MNEELFELYISFHTANIHNVMDGVAFCSAVCSSCKASELCNGTPSPYKPTVSSEFLLKNYPEVLV